jgi:hypothetical protein
MAVLLTEMQASSILTVSEKDARMTFDEDDAWRQPGVLR